MSFAIRPYEPSDLEGLLQAWRAAVEVSHSFLTPEEIERTGPSVAELIAYYETYVATDEQEHTFGFLSLDQEAVQLLFVHPAGQGLGAGTALLDLARRLYGPLTVDVHEQNSSARAFYQRRGFRDAATWDAESWGRKFPVIHMEQS